MSEEKNKECKPPKRIFAKRLTIGMLEDADIPLNEFGKLEFKSTKDFSIARELLNTMIIEGEPFTRDTDPIEIFEAFEHLSPALESFLEKGRRFEAAKEKLKSKRSPRQSRTPKTR